MIQVWHPLSSICLCLLFKICTGQPSSASGQPYVLSGKEGSTPIQVPLDDGSVIDVWPVLGFTEGDIPWLSKLTNSVGHGAKHACYRCGMNGVWHHEAKTVRCDNVLLVLHR